MSKLVYVVEYTVPAVDKTVEVRAKSFDEAAAKFHSACKIADAIVIHPKGDPDNERAVLGFCEICRKPIYMGDSYRVDMDAGIKFCAKCSIDYCLED